jgi:hypothetical protein
MFRFSLKELLYWITIWCVGTAAFSTLIPAPTGVIVLGIWLIGTTAINKACGYRAGFGYASLVGFAVWLLALVTDSPSFNPSPPPRYGMLLAFLLLLGLVSGSLVWSVVFCFDKLYSLLSLLGRRD